MPCFPFQHVEDSAMMAESVDLTENRQTEVLVVAWVMTGAAVMTVVSSFLLEQG